jgi:hypothetical protein
MARKVVAVTHPDGTKKVIVGQPSNETLVITKESEDKKRPKPGTPAVGLTKQRNGYKRGGKIKFKAS